MTNEEAIYLLRNTAWLAPTLEPIDEAIEMACEALRQADTPQTEDKCKGCIYENADSLMACVSCQGKVPYNGYELQTDCETCKYGQDKDRYAHICNECGVGINNYEPQTEEEILREQCRAFIDIVKQTDCPWK